MKMLLIGHRGVGKSSLLQRLQIYSSLRGSTIPVFDLDREIEKSVGAKTQDIFDLMGEKNFRVLEKTTYQHVLKRSDYILALGAGIQLDELQIDPDVQIVWVQRKTDQLGRVFLDRPRLNPQVTAIEEFQERFQARNKLYSKHATWIYHLPEGLSSPSEIENQIFFNQLDDVGGILTLHEGHFQHLQNFKNREWKWDFDFFEIRDDLLTDQQMQPFFALIAKDHLLLSFRNQKSSETLIRAAGEGYSTDWPVELGKCLCGSPSILSLHERLQDETVHQAIARLENAALANEHLKLAIEIQNFQELAICLSWQAQDPKNRSFLPRSNHGKWNWVRMWLKDRQKLNFIAPGFGAVADQPTLFEWQSTPAQPRRFAAVLGHPILHSYSPIEHAVFFKQLQMPFFAIDIEEIDWKPAMDLLQKMGLKFAAVTAPLKKLAFEFADHQSANCKELQTANTFSKINQNWHADNTDIEGLQDLFQSVELIEPIHIWGGGGTLPVIQKLLPKAESFSVRTGQARNQKSETLPSTVIWAASPTAAFPPSDWHPKLIIDLNYRDDSQAKEYCQKIGARYISGLYMFKSQAQAQRNIWGKVHDSK